MSEPTVVDEKSVHCLAEGDFVRWYDLGPDEVHVRDTGTGIVIKICHYVFPSGSFFTFRVLCDNGVLRMFERGHLKFLDAIL